MTVPDSGSTWKNTRKEQKDKKGQTTMTDKTRKQLHTMVTRSKLQIMERNISRNTMISIFSGYLQALEDSELITKQEATEAFLDIFEEL